MFLITLGAWETIFESDYIYITSRKSHYLHLFLGSCVALCETSILLWLSVEFAEENLSFNVYIQKMLWSQCDEKVLVTTVHFKCFCALSASLWCNLHHGGCGVVLRFCSRDCLHSVFFKHVPSIESITGGISILTDWRLSATIAYMLSNIR